MFALGGHALGFLSDNTLTCKNMLTINMVLTATTSELNCWQSDLLLSLGLAVLFLPLYLLGLPRLGAVLAA